MKIKKILVALSIPTFLFASQLVGRESYAEFEQGTHLSAERTEATELLVKMARSFKPYLPNDYVFCESRGCWASKGDKEQWDENNGPATLLRPIFIFKMQEGVVQSGAKLVGCKLIGDNEVESKGCTSDGLIYYTKRIEWRGKPAICGKSFGPFLKQGSLVEYRSIIIGLDSPTGDTIFVNYGPLNGYPKEEADKVWDRFVSDSIQK